MDGEDDEIMKDSVWDVITSYFDEKGLVRQQLDSYDEFITNSIHEIVEESFPIDIYPEPDVPESSKEYTDKRKRYR